jgi:hypothetical protein
MAFTSGLYIPLSKQKIALPGPSGRLTAIFMIG